MSQQDIQPGSASPLKAVPIKAYSKKDLCREYNISYKVLAKWLEPFKKEVGDCNGRFFTVAQVRIIFERLGEP